jgi:hypothetical protein
VYYINPDNKDEDENEDKELAQPLLISKVAWQHSRVWF